MCAYGRGWGDWQVPPGRVNREGEPSYYPWYQRFNYALHIYTKKWDLESNYTPIVTPTPSVPGESI